jgi:hypothetical protein
MARIFSRSPYIVSINESGSITTTIELFIWNGTGSAPTIPTYSISKNVPSSSNVLTTYNISPYIQEFIEHNSVQNPTTATATPTAQWCNVLVKRYADRDFLDQQQFKAYNGYGYYGEGSNPQLSPVMLSTNTTYYFHGTTNPIYAGHTTIEAGTGWNVKYYDANTNNLINTQNLTEGVNDVPLVYESTYSGDVLVKVFNGTTLITQYLVKRIEECKYTPVKVDFVNKFGAWQRMNFFKASYNSIETTSDEFNLLQANLVSYDILEGQRKQFNANGKESIRLNTGWVDENFSVQVQELLLSECILVDNKPAKMKTRNADFVKHINQNLINYTLEFDFAYDTINSVV